MTGEVVGLEEVVLSPPSAPAAFDKNRFGLFLFGGALMLLINFGDPAVGVINIPLSFFLKDRLHLQAHEQAMFRIWIAIPLFASFVFGFLRDRWSPFGAGDRGHLMLFGVATALVYASAALLTPSYAVLMTVMLLATAVFQMVLGAGSGLLASIGQQRAMAGQMSILFGIAATLPQLISNLAGGALSDFLEGQGATPAAQVIFLIAAALLAAIAFLAFLRPRALFNAAPNERSDSHFFQDIARLLKHWPVYPVIMIQVLWQFSPGSGTVLQYHMSNALHASDFEWGAWNAVFLGSFVPVFVGYGFLCQRFELSKLLWVGFGLAVFQMVPLLFVHSAVGAIIAACPMGIIGGIAQAALTDLAIRSCPKGLQGTMMLLFGTSIYYIAARFGDLLGTEIYDHHGGFFPAVWLTIIIYALILPLLFLVPKRLIATRDGEALLAPHP
ncbi:MAG TPA: MFS transporter [Caulobacteraceae bacterium]|jgi:MFS family permease|nr:MFS transporter [Caulobacteraceae bacterium]